VSLCHTDGTNIIIRVYVIVALSLYYVVPGNFVDEANSS